MEDGQDSGALVMPEEQEQGLKVGSGDSGLDEELPDASTEDTFDPDEERDDLGGDDSGAEEESVSGSTDTSPSACCEADAVEDTAPADDPLPSVTGKCCASKGAGDKCRRKGTGDAPVSATAASGAAGGGAKRRKTHKRRRRKLAEQGAEAATGFTCERCFRSKVRPRCTCRI